MAMEEQQQQQRHDLEDTIRARHSTRKFLATPVPRALLMEALSLAQCAPSNSNIQPWHLFIAEGVRRDRLREALLAECRRVPPAVPALPEEFKHYRQELGAVVYGSMGIAREDKQGRAAAVMRNWEFFGAPVVAIICLHQDLGRADAMSVGMYVQTLLLALTARGLGSCCEVSLAAYPDIIRKELDIPPELAIICGVAIGYTDESFPTNHLHVERAPVEHNVAILDSD
jgi:nitroreductase